MTIVSERDTTNKETFISIRLFDMHRYVMWTKVDGQLRTNADIQQFLKPHQDYATTLWQHTDLRNFTDTDYIRCTQRDA